jgi:hypothetical protein
VLDAQQRITGGLADQAIGVDLTRAVLFVQVQVDPDRRVFVVGQIVAAACPKAQQHVAVRAALQGLAAEQPAAAVQDVPAGPAGRKSPLLS